MLKVTYGLNFPVASYVQTKAALAVLKYFGNRISDAKIINAENLDIGLVEAVGFNIPPYEIAHNLYEAMTEYTEDFVSTVDFLYVYRKLDSDEGVLVYNSALGHGRCLSLVLSFLKAVSDSKELDWDFSVRFPAENGEPSETNYEPDED